MISPAEADALIGRHLACLPIESLPLVQCAGAVLRENIYGERDQPPFDRVAMDGIAIDSAAVRGGLARLRVQAMQAAGDPPLTLANGQHCIEIMTVSPRASRSCPPTCGSKAGRTCIAAAPTRARAPCC